MSDVRTIVALAVPAVPLAGGLLLQLARSPRSQDWANRVVGGADRGRRSWGGRR